MAETQTADSGQQTFTPPSRTSDRLFEADAGVREVYDHPDGGGSPADIEEIQNIDEISTDSPKRPTHDEERVEAEEKPTEQEAKPPEDAESLAKALNLDPVKDLDTIERILNAMSPAEETSAEDEVGKKIKTLLDDLQRDEESVKPVEKTTVTQQSDNSGKVAFGDIGDSWTSMEDGYKAYSEAMDSGNHRLAAEVGTAINSRQLVANLPVIANISKAIAKQMLDQELGELRPVIQEYRESQMEARAQAKAEKLLKEQLGDTFSALFRPDGKGPVMWDGQEMDAIPYNRIVSENPHIAKISVQHKDPEKAKTLTHAERYAAAYRIYSKEQRQLQSTTKAAKTVAAAAAESGARTERDRTRQTANAGGRTNGKMESGKAESQENFIKNIRENSPGRTARLLFG